MSGAAKCNQILPATVLQRNICVAGEYEYISLEIYLLSSKTHVQSSGISNSLSHSSSVLWLRGEKNYCQPFKEHQTLHC